MDKLVTLQQQLQEAEDKKVALQDQVRPVCDEQDIVQYVCVVGARGNIHTIRLDVAPDQCSLLCAGDRLREQTTPSGAANIRSRRGEDKLGEVLRRATEPIRKRHR